MQFDKEEFQEIGSMDAFRVLKTQFQQFIDLWFSLDDDDGQMTSKYCIEYTRIEVQHFHDTLIQHMESVKKSIDERELHKREYDNRDECIRSGNDTYTDNTNIKPVYDEEPMAKVQLTTECNIFGTRQQHVEQPKFNNEGDVDQNDEQCHDKCPFIASLTDSKTTELSNQSLKSENICL
ncbi:hypothetical protein Tco_1538389 [Tanacetum coccineum]